MGFTKTCAQPLKSTRTHLHSLPPTATHSYPLPPTSIYPHLLLPSSTYSHPSLSTSTHSHTSPSTPTHLHPLPLMLSLVILILNIPPPKCSLSHPFPVHIQILSLNPTHRLAFQPIFTPCVLCAYIRFNVNLFFLLFSVLFWKQLITLGLTTIFVYFQFFCLLKILIQWGEYINV